MSATNGSIAGLRNVTVLEEPPLVGIVVVDFDGPDDTIACVESLLAQDYRTFFVVVVDNGSANDDRARIGARFGGDIEIIRSQQNDGYGAGANIGIRRALARGALFVWLLNNDTTVEPEALATLVVAMASDPTIGIASPQIRAPEGRDAPGGVWYAGGEIDLAKGETRHRTKPLPAQDEPIDTSFVTGTAPILRRETLERIGLFWEPLFLFWEDTDLCLRAQRGGWRTCVVPMAWIYHRVHGSTTASVVARYHYRNALIVASRHGSRLVLFSAALHLGLLVARLWASALVRRRPRPTSAFLGYVAGLRALIPKQSHG